MARLEPWYKVVTLRKEVREGRSFNPDEFAIALEQVVSKTAPPDYRDPAKFFSRTCFTRALTEHSGMVLRRLAGKTDNTAPVLTLITQFGGGKTHTLTALYHIAKSGNKAIKFNGISRLLESASLKTIPKTNVGVFVGNAWDPQEGRETPWIDLARQLAGDKGVEVLGKAAKKTPPGTEAIQRVFQEANGPVLLLFDEVLNYLNRHRDMADSFHAFIHNLTVAMTGTTKGAAIISLPRSQVEMTDWDSKWQDKITKVVRRVAKDLIANDEAEISEVVRRRLFEDLGGERLRKNVSRTFADWCFERRAQLPPEWTAVDTATTEAKAREFLLSRFENCYPFHPSTLSVFQRKWAALSQYQQTRGTLAMLAQWISIASQESFKNARTEPLITLGSAPLSNQHFRGVVLGQLGESKLISAIDADIASQHSHARALDADSSGKLRDIHRRVATAVLFESSGGQTDKVAHLPELRFAIGEPDIDTTSIDNAAFALEDKSFFIRRVGADGFRISYKPTLRKVVSDQRASLNEDTEIIPAMEKLVEQEFRKGAGITVICFPKEAPEIHDSPKLTLVVAHPDMEWNGGQMVKKQIAEWTKNRGKSSRLYPGALVWCIRKPGRDLRDKVELMLAWRRVARGVSDGTIGGEFETSERADIQSKVMAAEDAAKDEVWGGYRYAILFNKKGKDGLKLIDLGAGHSSSGQTLCGRIIATLKSEALLNESVGAGYIDRNWPPALKKSGAWPLASLRQSFLDGSLTRLLDPDVILKIKIPEFVEKGDFGLASGQKKDGDFERIWFEKNISPDEVSFEKDVFLLIKATARKLKSSSMPEITEKPDITIIPEPTHEPSSEPDTTKKPADPQRSIRIKGEIPPELWNRLGTKLLPKIRSGSELKVGVEFSINIQNDIAENLIKDLKQIIDDLGLVNKIYIE